MRKFKFDRVEFAGALGDLGTFVPIFIALVAINGFNPTVILILVGVLYIICGFYYNLPIPVQPLKALSAIAIANGLGPPVVSAAGIMIGIILLFLAISGLADFISRMLSLPIIRGVQLGVGLMLIQSGCVLITKMVVMNKTGLFPIGNELLFELIVILGGLALMLILLRNQHLPASIGILSFGIIVSMINSKANAIPITLHTPSGFILSIPTIDSFIKAFLLVIPQLPLTICNSIVATKDTAKRYFGEQANKVTARSLSISIGIANIAGGLIGGMPVCHGSGGLTSHYRFGARTGGACIIIGSIFLVLSLIFGSEISKIFALLPHSILGIMLVYVGFRHAGLITDLKKKKELFIALGIGLTFLLITLCQL